MNTKSQIDGNLGIHGQEKMRDGGPKWSYFRKDVVDYETELLYGSNGPWPTPSPGRPLSEFAEVCNLPQAEHKDWKKNVSRMYMWIIATRFIPGLWWAYVKSKGQYDKFNDEHFNAHITNGMYSKFLCELDEGDASLFEERIPEIKTKPELYLKMDFSGMEWIVHKTYPDTYVAPTIALFKILPNSNGNNYPDYQAVAIHIYQCDEEFKKIDDTADTLVPDYVDPQLSKEDKNRWELAKYYVLQGAVHRINMTEHGLLHFPHDSVNAITKSILPTQHPLFRLLHPHLRLSLAVNNAVLEGTYSLLSRTNWVVYSPFAAEGKYTRRLIPDGYVGRPGKPNAFPVYRFDPEPKYPNTSYGVYLEKNYKIFLKFVTSVIKETLPAEYLSDDNSGVRRNWELIALWGESIAEWVPGFPMREDLLEENAETQRVSCNRELLIKTIAKMIWTLSVAHAGDHFGFGQAGPTRNVFRIHVKPPLKDVVVEDSFFKKLVKPWDLFQSYLTNELFYKPHNTVDLVDVTYDFKNHPNELKIQGFRDLLVKELKECDIEEHQRDEKLPPLGDVSSSIQY